MRARLRPYYVEIAPAPPIVISGSVFFDAELGSATLIRLLGLYLYFHAAQPLGHRIIPFLVIQIVLGLDNRPAVARKCLLERQPHRVSAISSQVAIGGLSHPSIKLGCVFAAGGRSIGRQIGNRR